LVIDTPAWRERMRFEGGEHSANSGLVAEMQEAAGP